MPPSLPARLSPWFTAHHRDLPWRRSGPPGRRDPYHELLSEFMLQQTQVSRVIDKFLAFVARFPTLRDLADAPTDDVLALWSGLGYYRRARLLHAAARAIVDRHAGQVPRDLESLRALPGIGPYTAGAIASIAFDQPAPAVDGNVLRVLLRHAGRDGAADDPDSLAWTWKRAESLVRAAPSPGLLNESLMELGATICTPKAPRCGSCPLAADCVARREGRQASIPVPKSKPQRQTITHTCLIVRDARGRLLLEQRPQQGLWAKLWQPPTLDRRASAGALVRELLPRFRTKSSPRRFTAFTIHTSHREVKFTIYELARPLAPTTAQRALQLPPNSHASRRAWIAPSDIDDLGISNAHRRALRSPE